MAKKKKQPQAPVQLTRGQLTRAAEEQKRIRTLYTAAIGIGTLIVLVLGLAVVTTFLIRPNAEVARVNLTEDKVITRAAYDKLRRYSLYQTMENNYIQQQISSQGAGTTAGSSLDTDVNAFQNEANEETLDPNTVYQLVDAEVARQASAKQFNLNPSQADLKTYALKDFEPQPTPPTTPTTPEPSPAASSPTITATRSITPTATTTSTATATATIGSPTRTATPSATLPPVPGAQKTAESTYDRYVTALSGGSAPKASSSFCQLGCPDLSEPDYLALIVEPRYLHDQTLEKLIASPPITDVEQIHVQHILTDTQAGAQKIKDMLDKGADFTQLANTQSSEQLTNIKNGQKPNGGDLGWTPQEDSSFVPEFTAAAFKVPVGKYSDPVHTSFGWHIIKVLASDPKRPLPDDVLTRKKTRIYDDWLSKQKDAAKITYTHVPAPTTTPVPATPLVSEPTQPAGTPAAPASPVGASPTAARGSPTPQLVSLPAASPSRGGSPGTGSTPGASGTPGRASTSTATRQP